MFFKFYGLIDDFQVLVTKSVLIEFQQICQCWSVSQSSLRPDTKFKVYQALNFMGILVILRCFVVGHFVY